MVRELLAWAVQWDEMAGGCCVRVCSVVSRGTIMEYGL
jgi:hypothetical protein